MDKNIKCVFDTNIFNRVLDLDIPVEAFSHRVSAYATHVQRDEINNTRKDERREALANIFTDVIPHLWRFFICLRFFRKLKRIRFLLKLCNFWKK